MYTVFKEVQSVKEISKLYSKKELLDTLINTALELNAGDADPVEFLLMHGHPGYKHFTKRQLIRELIKLGEF